MLAEARLGRQHAHPTVPFFSEELQKLAERAIERRDREVSLTAELAAASAAGAALAELPDDVTAVFRQREDRVVAELLQMGRSLEADIASLGIELDNGCKELPARRREPHASSGTITTGPSRPLDETSRLAVAWLTWLRTAAETRQRSSAYRTASEALRLQERSTSGQLLYAWRFASMRAVEEKRRRSTACHSIHGAMRLQRRRTSALLFQAWRDVTSAVAGQTAAMESPSLLRRPPAERSTAGDSDHLGSGLGQASEGRDSSPPLSTKASARGLEGQSGVSMPQTGELESRGGDQSPLSVEAACATECDARDAGFEGRGGTPAPLMAERVHAQEFGSRGEDSEPLPAKVAPAWGHENWGGKPVPVSDEAALARKLEDARVALQQMDPAIAELVNRLGGKLLFELSTAAQALRVAHDLLLRRDEDG